MATDVWVDIGSGNGLLLSSNKPLPEIMLNDIQWDLVAFTSGQFHRKCWRYLSWICVWKLLIYDYCCISLGPMSWTIYNQLPHLICYVNHDKHIHQNILLTNTNDLTDKHNFLSIQIFQAQVLKDQTNNEQIRPIFFTSVTDHDLF